jgi:hypothetical protein
LLCFWAARRINTSTPSRLFIHKQSLIQDAHFSSPRPFGIHVCTEFQRPHKIPADKTSSSVGLAAPTAQNKQFKVAIETTKGAAHGATKAAKTGTTVYLSNSGSTKNAADALVCTLSNGTSGTISCGGKGFTVNSLHTSMPLTPTPGNTGTWKIGADDTLTWYTGKTEVHLSTKSVASTSIYAEVCSTSGHGDATAFYPGYVKAVYV